VQTLINSAGERTRKCCWNSYADCKAERDGKDSIAGIGRSILTCI